MEDRKASDGFEDEDGYDRPGPNFKIGCRRKLCLDLKIVHSASVVMVGLKKIQGTGPERAEHQVKDPRICRFDSNHVS